MSRELLRDTINELINTERTFINNMETFVKLIRFAAIKNKRGKDIEKALDPYDILSQPSLLYGLEPLKPDCSDADITNMLEAIHYALLPTAMHTQQRNRAFNAAAADMANSLDLLQTQFVSADAKQSAWQRMVNRKADLTPQQAFTRIYDALKKDHTLPADAPGTDKIIFNFMIQAVQRPTRYVLLINEVKKNADGLSVAAKDTLEQTSQFTRQLTKAVDKSAPEPSVAPKPSVAASTPPAVAPMVAAAAPAEPDPIVSRPPEFPPAPVPTKMAPRRAERTDSPTNGVGLFDQNEERAEPENDEELEMLVKILLALNQANMTLCAALKMPVPEAQLKVNEYCQQLLAEEEPTPTVRKVP